MKKLFYIFYIIISISVLSACDNTYENNQKLPYNESAFLLGTLIDITTYDKADTELMKKAFDRINEIETKMTINSDNTSEIISLNKFSGKNSVILSKDTFYVLSKGKYYSEMSKGKFDITIGTLVKLWNIGTDKATKPSQQMIDEKLPLVDYNMLELYDNNTAKLLNEGMMVDLGAIAKGYAADEVKNILVKGGITSALVNIGGNIITIGNKLDGSLWNIGVQNPFLNRGEYVGIMQLSDETMVTSGTYEKYFEENGVRYHHILDTSTGYPCNNELSSVSIITKNSIDADSLSTTAFVMGLKDGIEFINGLDGVDAIFITNDKKIYLTSNISEERFKLSDTSFSIDSISITD